MTKRVERAVRALLDDEVRQHREIPNDRVERSIEERALTEEESLALHERLGEEGVAVTFDKEEDETVADDTFPESEEARADRTVSRDLLRACLADIAGRPLLTLEEEAQLARKIAEARRVEQALSGGELAKTPVKGYGAKGELTQNYYLTTKKDWTNTFWIDRNVYKFTAWACGFKKSGDLVALHNTRLNYTPCWGLPANMGEPSMEKVRYYYYYTYRNGFHVKVNFYSPLGVWWHYQY